MLFPHFFSILRYLVVFCTLPSFGKCGVLLNRLSCVSLRPVGGNMLESGMNPFTATASPSVYTPGTPIQITISAANGETFTGMILQGRVNGSMTPIGSFSPTNGFVNFDCGGDTFATLTDDGSTATRTLPLVFTWNPPNFVIGRSITIYIVIVVRPGYFWWLKVILISFQIGCNAGMCQNGGTCEIVQPNDEVYCMCPPPFTGPLCTDCATTPCDDSSSCPARASCIPDSNCNSRRCVSIVGTECSTCGEDPCLNDGVCVHNTSLPYSFRCECPAGLVGEICDTALREITGPAVYELTEELRSLVVAGRISYIVFVLRIRITARIEVGMIDIQGFEVFSGKGMPGQNPRRPGLRLFFEVEEERIFWFCLKSIADVTVFRFRIIIHLNIPAPPLALPPAPAPQQLYELPPDIQNLINNGNQHCLVFTVPALSKILPIIQGYIFSYGLGEPEENPQQPNLPLIVDAGNTFWISLRRVANPGMALFQLDIIELVAHLNIPAPLPALPPALLPAPAPQLLYQLPPAIQILIDNGNEHCLAFTVATLSKILPNIQGYIFSYGFGDPRDNPRQQDLPLIVDAENTFCICVTRLFNPGMPLFQLDVIELVAHLNIPAPPPALPPALLPAPAPQLLYQLPPAIQNLINNGNEHCLAFTVTTLSKILPNIQGYIFSYGFGDPRGNPQQQDLPLIVDAENTFCICVTRLFDPGMALFQLDVIELVAHLNIPAPPQALPPAPAPQLRYELPPAIQNLIDDGNEHCLAFTVATLSNVQPNIQGYIFFYGFGDPRDNPQQQNLPLIVNAGDTFCICLRRVFVGPGMGNFQLDIRELVVNFHQVEPNRPQPNYQLPPGLFNMITNGDIDCVVCTVNVRTQVNVNFILGFDFCYGTGVPLQNKQNDGPLFVPAGDSFWFCLEPTNPPLLFILNLQ